MKMRRVHRWPGQPTCAAPRADSVVPAMAAASCRPEASGHNRQQLETAAVARLKIYMVAKMTPAVKLGLGSSRFPGLQKTWSCRCTHAGAGPQQRRGRMWMSWGRDPSGAHADTVRCHKQGS